MSRTKISAKVSLAICIASAVLLLIWLFSFPEFFSWLYNIYNGFTEGVSREQAVVDRAENIVKTVVYAFYVCAPFAAAAIYFLIRLLLNIIHEVIFTKRNVKYLKIISYICYCVMLITLVFGVLYIPILIIAFATGLLGTLLRVVKNLMETAVEIKNENDMTI